MAEVVTMPRLSDTMTEGVIAKWHKKVGDKVKSGDLLAEIETDKATMEFESFYDGVLLYIGVKENEPVPVDSLIAIIGKEGENIEPIIQKYKNAQNQPSSEQKQAEKELKTSVQDKKTSNNHQTNISIDISNIPAKVVTMPRLSDTMTEGVIAKWHKKVGDTVKAGELLAEIETDKATMEFEAFESGKLLYIGVKEGERVPVDAVIAVIGEEGADVEKLINYYKQKQTTEQADKKQDSPLTNPQQTTFVPEIQVNDPVKVSQDVQTSSSSTQSHRIIASPLARRLAKEKNINLSLVKGTGPHGRIVKRDIENFTGYPSGLQAVTQEKFRDIPVNQMRKTIAKRLSESKFSAPHFYLTMEINMDAIVDTRYKINEISPVKISFNDIVIMAVARALRKHPKVNASWMGDFIRRYEHIHIGVAVAVEDGLLVPVIKFADTKTLSQIASEVKVFVEKAKNKQLQPQDWQGNTFTISNLGMYGIEEFTAIINPPDACILAVGAIIEKPVVKNNHLTIGYTMKVTLSCDHRVVDGATGAEFLRTLKNLLENPILLFGEHLI